MPPRRPSSTTTSSRKRPSPRASSFGPDFGQAFGEQALAWAGGASFGEAFGIFVDLVDQLAGAGHESLHCGIRQVRALLAVAPHLGVEILPLQLDPLDRLLAELPAPFLQLLQLLRRVVLLEHRHRLQGVQEVLG